MGLSFAKRFGKEGFRLFMIARNEENLSALAKELSKSGIESDYFLADLYNKEQKFDYLVEALRLIYSKSHY